MKRSYQAELMDDFSIKDERIDIALNELKVINKYLGGILTTKTALNHFVSSNDENLRILDIGSGSSDNLLAIKNKYQNLQIISVDRNLRVLKASDNIAVKINSDAFRLPLRNQSCDIVHAALFLHHFREEEIKILLEEFLRVAKTGIIINDLRRSLFALVGIKILTSLFSKSELVKNDAPLSVKRGFKKPDLLNLLSEIGIKNFIIRKKWAFRWMLIIKR
uniref:Methyltransferase domain-containing protein n=1 Tax=Ignavibacterium album TaxID=591197 RepID=A0A7V2ZHU8_9BACT